MTWWNWAGHVTVTKEAPELPLSFSFVKEKFIAVLFFTAKLKWVSQNGESEIDLSNKGAIVSTQLERMILQGLDSLLLRQAYSHLPESNVVIFKNSFIKTYIVV